MPPGVEPQGCSRRMPLGTSGTQTMKSLRCRLAGVVCVMGVVCVVRVVWVVCVVCHVSPGGAQWS